MPTLEGFLAAIAIGPRLVSPLQWLPWVWDQEHGNREPMFDSTEQASRMVSLLVRKYYNLIDALDPAAAPFEPAFGHDDERGAQQWCAGFLRAAMFYEAAWSDGMSTQPGWCRPFMRLGTVEGIDISAAEDNAQTWVAEVAPALMCLRAQWRQSVATAPADWFEARPSGMPLMRETPKVGRNNDGRD